ncbi:MAG: DNA primase, partial [Rhodothermaceae bacterium]|nr:DNA primase [Rhodothermaceae bacterium]
MARIPDSTVDDVRAAVDLVDVVSDYVRLKKQGVRFVGLCPFHNEKTPSFSVDSRQDLFYCFGCKRGGDLFKFIEEIEGVGFLDSVRLLADRAGIEIAEEEGNSEEASEKEAMLGALRFAARFFFDQLKTPRGQRAIDYLGQRGFTKETVKTFGIGYAPDSWDTLLKAATAAQFKPEILEQVGLVKRREKGDGHYDVFRDRLMFPILSPVGKVLGFGGRIMPDTKKDGDFEPAKYINTSETPVYHKSEVLYGLKQAKTAIRGEEEALLVEGYADVVSLFQAGIKHVVASSGTALTPQQVRLLGRYARTVVLLYDADNAGVNAALKGIETVLAGGLAVYAVTLPDGADPDSFVQRFGAEAFRTLLREERQDFVGFIVQHARRLGGLDTPEGKAKT